MMYNRMHEHEMRTIAFDDPGVCQFVCHAASLSERIKVLLQLETLGDPRNIVLDGNPDFSHGYDAAFANLLWPLVYWHVCVC